MDWLDWLSDPAWLAVIVAVVLGVPAVVLPIRHRAASESERKLEQARKVWARAGPALGKRRGGEPGDMGRRFLGGGPSVIGDERETYEAKEEDGKRYVVLTRDLTIFRVRIVNNSDGPISRCYVTLSGLGARRLVDDKWVRVNPELPRWEHKPRERAAEVISPGEEVLVRVVVPFPHAEIETRHPSVTIRFADSSGQRWERTNMKQPHDISRPRPPRFAKLRGGWHRTRYALSRKQTPR